MDFPDVPFGEDVPTFMGHKHVLGYLQQFAEDFNLHKNIRFHTHVEKMEPVAKESLGDTVQSTANDDMGFSDTVKWMVQTRDLEQGTVSKEIYDIVFICTG